MTVTEASEIPGEPVAQGGGTLLLYPDGELVRMGEVSVVFGGYRMFPLVRKALDTSHEDNFGIRPIPRPMKIPEEWAVYLPIVERALATLSMEPREPIDPREENREVHILNSEWWCFIAGEHDTMLLLTNTMDRQIANAFLNCEFEGWDRSPEKNWWRIVIPTESKLHASES